VTFDIDRLLDSLQTSLVEVLRALDRGESVELKRTEEAGGMTVASNFTIRTIDQALRESARREAPLTADHEPLIDVLETERDVKVLVSLPGVTKRDVRVSFRKGGIHIRITRGGRVIEREIPCSVRPEEVTVVSTVENNSVIELRFSRRRTSDHAR
jgi:HSP20 family molecular chaperone IbpA